LGAVIDKTMTKGRNKLMVFAPFLLRGCSFGDWF